MGWRRGCSQFQTLLVHRVHSDHRADVPYRRVPSAFRAFAGGLFALYCLTTEPSLFSVFCAESKPRLGPQLAATVAGESFRIDGKLEAFLYIARSDDTGRPLEDYERFVQTLKTKSPQGFRWFSQAFPDETHAGVPLLAEIDALRHLYHGYRFHNDLLPKGLAYAEQHFKDVSKKVGWPLVTPESVINEFGYAALSQGKTPDAIGLFKRNVEANPNSANAYDSLADGYAKAGQWKDAVEASEKAVALATQFSNPKRSYFIEQAKKMNDRLKQAPGPSK